MPDKDGRSATLLQEELPLDNFDAYSDMNSPRSKSAVIFPVSTDLPRRTLAIVVVLVWFFCWPRVPVLTLGSATVKDGPVWGPNDKPSLQSDWFVNITIDNTANWVPTRINDIAFNVLDTNTQQVVGTGNTNALTLPGRSVQTLNLTVAINYTAASQTDQTFTDLYSACGPQKIGAPPQLSIDFQVCALRCCLVRHGNRVLEPF
ncbi:hypothetical protein Unana1_03023 [Umbelopsis nana]